MSHSRLVRSLFVDVAVGALATSAMIGIALVAPDWLVGALCVALVPGLIFVAVLAAAYDFRRRESEVLGVDHAHSMEPRLAYSPRVASPATEPGALPSSRLGRPTPGPER